MRQNTTFLECMIDVMQNEASEMIGFCWDGALWIGESGWEGYYIYGYPIPHWIRAYFK